MSIVNYTYRDIFQGVMTYASVTLEIAPSHSHSHKIIAETELIPFQSQGLLEGGHANWIGSAEQAIALTLENIQGLTHYDVYIRKLEGRILLDTNNASIGVACYLAICQFFDKKPSNTFLNALHEWVRSNWDDDVTIIPDFQILRG